MLISAGKTSLALDLDGYAWDWGYNGQGILGDNTNITRSSPVSVVGGKQFSQISAGLGCPLALDLNGYAWGWGSHYGFTSSSPVSVVGGKQFKSITSCIGSCGALDLDGYAWVWGNNSTGQLGNNTTFASYSPVSVVGGRKFSQIASGGGYAGTFYIALDLDGYIWSWGDNSWGQLGDNTTNNRSSPVSVVGNRKFSQIASGGHVGGILQPNGHSLAIDLDGCIWAWGYNGYYELGDRTTYLRSSPVSVVIGSLRFSKVAAGGGAGGDAHSLAIDTNGYAWGWGHNEWGEVGNNRNDNQQIPASVVGGIRFSQIAAGASHSLGLDVNGHIWAWGLNSQGELGDSTNIQKSSPVKLINMIWK